MFSNMNLPNKLTILRLILTPILILLMLGRYELSSPFLRIFLAILTLLFFIAIALSDYFDGYIARRDGLITNFGKLMDPIADKIFVFSILIVFVKYNLLSVWIVILLLSREFIVVSLRALIIENGGTVLAANNNGKFKTAFQMFAILFILIFGYFKFLNSLVMLPSLFFSILSMMEYINVAKLYIFKERNGI